jgi:hypothetical protein
MSGRGNNNRGGGNRQGRGRGNGPKPKITGGSNKKGAKEELGNHIFTYGTHNAADQMRQSWKYITTYVGNAYSGDMMAELHDRKTFVVPEPDYTDAVKTAHAADVVKYKAPRIGRELATQRRTLGRLQANTTPSSTTIMHMGETEDKISSLEEALTKSHLLSLPAPTCNTLNKVDNQKISNQIHHGNYSWVKRISCALYDSHCVGNNNV